GGVRVPAACQAEQQRPCRHGGQAAGGGQDQDAQPAVAGGVRQRDKSQQALAQRFGQAAPKAQVGPAAGDQPAGQGRQQGGQSQRRRRGQAQPGRPAPAAPQR